MIKEIKRTSRFKKDYKNVRECHIAPDWLLIYRINKSELILELIRTGAYIELFK